MYSLTRVVRPETGSKLAYNLAMVEGYEDTHTGRCDTLRGVRALSPDQLEVRLNQPFHEIAAVFGHLVTVPVPVELVEGDPERFRVHPVSNGPYRTAEPDGGGGHVDRVGMAVYEEVDNGFASAVPSRRASTGSAPLTRSFTAPARSPTASCCPPSPEAPARTT